MKRERELFLAGLVIMVAGLVIGISSFVPSQWVQYVVAIAALFAGTMAIRTSRKSGIPAAYRYSWIEGVVFVLYAILVFALEPFLDVTMLFLIIFGLVEFTLTLQTIGASGPPNWSVVAQKLITSVVSGVGGTYIFISTSVNNGRALLVLGIVAMLIGASFIFASKQEESSHQHSVA